MSSCDIRGLRDFPDFAKTSSGYKTISCKNLKPKIYQGQGPLEQGRLMSALSRSSHALVTGGGRGIGREIAAALSRAGATVTVLGRHRNMLDDILAYGFSHISVAADVRDQAAVDAA